MQLSRSSKGALVAVLGALLVAGIVLYTALGTASEQRKETKRGFALNFDGSLVAYHFSQASEGGGIRRGIRVHSTDDGSVIHLIEGTGNLQVHSPAFDGEALIAGTICWSDKCPDGLSGSRLISIDLGTGQWQALTDDGYQTPFWDFGYVNQAPGSVAIQAMRSDPVVTADGIYYLTSAANVREVTSARDFAPRRLKPKDDYVLNDGVAVGFRGRGSMAPFGPDALLITGGAVRGGPAEASSRDEKAFAYLIDRETGTIQMTWTAPALEKSGMAPMPAPQTATGDPMTDQGFVAVAADVVRLTKQGIEAFYSGGTTGPRIQDIALSGDGQRLLIATRRPDSDVPALDYFTMDAGTKSRYEFRLDTTAVSKNNIQIQ